MPLHADVPIVTDEEVAAITGEAGLDRLEDEASGLTRLRVREQATNFLALYLRGQKGVDPARVANVAELKIPAACHVAFVLLAAQPDPEMQARAIRLRERRDEALKLFVFVSTVAQDPQTLASKGLPRTWNFDRPGFTRG